MDLNQMTDREILSLRFKDLKLALEKSAYLQKGIRELYRDLGKKGLKFRPHIWVSDDWFCPDGVAGFAVPFYLLHPRLMKLEKQMVGECEGDRYPNLMKLLRHETGHAIDNAYRMRKLHGRVELFGDHTTAYPTSYEYRAYSTQYVRHIKPHYAQAHPDEDWAETFAVYLGSQTSWMEKYRGTQALEKLRFMKREVEKVKNLAPLLKNKRRIDPIENDNRTLAQYYRQKRKVLKVDQCFFSNRALPKELLKKSQMAQKSTISSHVEKEIIQIVAKKINGPQYRVKGMMNQLKSSWRRRGVKVDANQIALKKEMVKYLVDHSSTYFENGEHRVIM